MKFDSSGSKRIRTFFQLARFLLCVLCTLLLSVPQYALALPPSAVEKSNAITAPEKIPLLLGSKISATAGRVPLRVQIKIEASGMAQGMRIETASGDILSGAESFKRNNDGTKVYELEADFSESYKGKLFVYLKNENGNWVNTNTEFDVNYEQIAVTSTPKPILTPTPKPTQKVLSVTSNTVFKAEASSVYRQKYNNADYSVTADMAVDGDLETAWNEGGSGTGAGEWIRLTPVDRKEYTYNGFKIANGFQYHTYHKGDRWKKNNRVASLNVYANGNQYIGTYSIEDRQDGYQIIYFDTPVKCSSLLFEIASAWEGKQFSETCISELRPF